MFNASYQHNSNLCIKIIKLFNNLMALKRVRIVAVPDAFQFDDGDFTEAIDTDGLPIEIGASTAATQAIRQDQIAGGTPANVVSAAANITDNAIVRGNGGAKGIQGSLASIDDLGSQNIPTGQGYKVNNIQVVTDQQVAESDLAVVPDLTGADTIDQAGLETYLGDIRTTLNSLLTKLRTHGLIDT
jgi:hypothetical protein